MGDKTQLLVVALAARYAKPGPLLAGIAVAATANALVAAIGGAVLSGMVPYRALSLLTALAFVFAGGGGLFPAKPPKVAIDWKTGAFVTAAAAFALVEFGDKTQFITAAMSARTGSPALAGAGAALGVIAASVPAVVLGSKLSRRVPVRGIRLAVAILFLLAGLWMAASALRLV